MQSKPLFESVQEMKNHWYPSGVATRELAKADAPIVSDTTGVRNVIFGRKLYVQVVNSATTVGILSKSNWEKSGYRVITAQSSTGVIGGTSEGGAIGDTVKPTFQEITVAPKITHIPFEVSSTQAALEGKDDTIYLADTVEYMNEEFLNMINQALLQDNDTLASTKFESIDRVVGSYAEVTGGGMTAGDLDIYGIDRDAAESWADSYVSHGSQTDRTFDLQYVDSLITNCRPYWSNRSQANKVWLANDDVIERWERILQAQQRYSDGTYTMGENGLQGADTGLILGKYKGIPMFGDSFVPQDTIGRVYLLDLDNIGLDWLVPPQHLSSDNYIANNKFTDVHVNYTEGELWATKFKSHGKGRDFK